jgi:hypothetical protein
MDDRLDAALWKLADIGARMDSVSERRLRRADDWSPEAREAAAEARRKGSHHAEQAEYHRGQATARGESLGKPAKGSHAAASSQHNSAAFHHEQLAKAHESGNEADVKEYGKSSAQRASIANSSSKKIASGKSYPEEKENSYQRKEEGHQAGFARRAGRYLTENRGR